MRILSKQHIFRPGDFASACHASTLAKLWDGSILAAWFAGTREGHADAGIWCARCENGVWHAPTCVFRDDNFPCWNPVLMVGENGVAHLLFKVGRSPRDWHTLKMSSRDNGQTFSPPRAPESEGYFGCGPVKNKPLRLPGGRWLAGASIERIEGNRLRWDSFVDVSEDEGEHFRAQPLLETDHDRLMGPGFTQPALWQSDEGHVHMLLRTGEGALYRSDSNDGGVSFCAPYPTALPSNNSGIDIARMPDGALALVLNPVGRDWGARTPLALLISRDNGSTWPEQHILEHMEGGEFSYPAIVAEGDRLLISYTWNRRTIEFVECIREDAR